MRNKKKIKKTSPASKVSDDAHHHLLSRDKKGEQVKEKKIGKTDRR